MVIVACLMLPMAALALYGMDRLEDWLTRTPQAPRHARRRHLRLVQGGKHESLTRPRNGQARSNAA
ncbi:MULTISPECIES: hypothetical protein [unclassified Streptomyces]|uniref:hypothetical protein n=1 Tax=unclassified Streptomyces TaxID=2593676 RepID=UPI00093EA6BB|nr:hypothetical protein [Streptomyces sp. CB01883]OKJ74384.1 hypothetical protein AMK32_35950 [Streptomyces sp. CB01883]